MRELKEYARSWDLTQRKLGLKLGYEEHNAGVRIARYESGYRVPKNNI